MRSVNVSEYVQRSGGSVYTNLKSYIEELQDYMNKIPSDYKDTAIINISAYEDYSSPSVCIDIYFTRPENSSEKKERLDREKAYEDRRIADAKKVLGIT